MVKASKAELENASADYHAPQYRVESTSGPTVKLRNGPARLRFTVSSFSDDGEVHDEENQLEWSDLVNKVTYS